MQISLEARLLITALAASLIWALAPHPRTMHRAWIEPGTSVSSPGAPPTAAGIRH